MLRSQALSTRSTSSELIYLGTVASRQCATPNTDAAKSLLRLPF